MSDRELIELLRLLAAEGCIDSQIFIRGDDGPVEVHAHVPRRDDEAPRPEQLSNTG